MTLTSVFNKFQALTVCAGQICSWPQDYWELKSSCFSNNKDEHRIKQDLKLHFLIYKETKV